jgi:hypothetical protein
MAQTESIREEGGWGGFGEQQWPRFLYCCSSWCWYDVVWYDAALQKYKIKEEKDMDKPSSVCWRSTGHRRDGHRFPS